MRPLPVILALSLAANAGLAFTYMTTARNDAKRSTAARSSSQSASAFAVVSPENIPDADPVRLAEALKSRDPKTLYGQLRALGFTDGNARDLVQRFIWMGYYNRQRELLAAKRSASGPYWRGPDQTTRNYTAEERKELRELANQANRETIAVLGSSPMSGPERDAERYGFLPREKIGQLQELMRDYSEMGREIGAESTRFKVASDADKQRLLHAEYKNDLAGIFTPDELTAYEQRYSSTAYALRRNFSGIDATESEYLAVYNILKDIDDVAPVSSGPTPDRDALKIRFELRKQANEEIKALLGEERYADYTRAQSSDYRSLQAAADRFQIPVETINNVYALRDVATGEYQRISTDTSLSSDAKKQALMAAAEKIRTQVREQLGDEVGDAYLEKNMAVLKRMSGSSPTGRKSMPAKKR